MHRKSDKGIVTLSRDVSQSFQACVIGMAHASSLVRALEVVNISEDQIEELKVKCLTSKQFIAAQIPWASAGAERSRRERDTRKVIVGDGSSYSDQQTMEERLLADILEVNAELNRAINICWSFQAYRIGMDNARALLDVTPEGVANRSECRKDMLKADCLTSIELITSQIDWVFAGAGRKHLGKDPKGAVVSVGGDAADRVVNEQPLEERLLTNLLNANEELNRAINTIY
ncbi:hypothetical protein VNI00_005390 [Paramarasmius palmivorus]|uniref:Uncharacterized protein n=1 Tax=Paramarasmius palmivorus TaxID=297713 RepID=A0AAW0DDT4_9AGAR